MHMIDTLICIVYIFIGAKWVLKKVEIETISAPTNWKIIVGSAIRNFYIYRFL